MADHSEDHRRSEDDFAPRGPSRPADEAAAPAVFNPKGIGSNVLLTAAAAVVPMVIIGVAGVKTFLGARKPRR